METLPLDDVSTPSFLEQLCTHILEAGWLLAIPLTVIFFNVYSTRVFEPDKSTTLRALSTLMLIVWIIFLFERKQRPQPLHFDLKTPLVLPALLTLGINLLSAIFSIAPRASFLGSYQRAQGIYSLFGYVMLFFTILTCLRTRLQLSRLLTVFIVTSVPVIIYAIDQHTGADPMPWGVDIENLISSTLGNSTYLAAYCVTLMPLTLSKLIEGVNDLLTDLNKRVSTVIRCISYTIILAGQALLLLYTQHNLHSRGAWLGFVIAIYFFFCLVFSVLVRHRKLSISWFGFGSVLLIMLFLINIPGPLQKYVQQTRWLKSVTQLSETQSGTGKVHMLIWQGITELILPHAPLEYPDGHKDILNPIRPLIGYGPETLYMAFNRFYPPELGHYESRTASPDRAKNETLDVLAMTGLLGLGAYLFTFGSIFYWGLRWLGLINTPKQTCIFMGTVLGSIILLTGLTTWLVAIYLIGIAIALGFVGGVLLYVTGYSVLPANKAHLATLPPSSHNILIIGILSAIMAHFIAINIGNATSVTYTTFWILTGLLVVLGQKWVPEYKNCNHLVL